eukprot:scaffold484090_cov26-Prasinocladus_malaysianus.AAC.1
MWVAQPKRASNNGKLITGRIARKHIAINVASQEDIEPDTQQKVRGVPFLRQKPFQSCQADQISISAHTKSV